MTANLQFDEIGYWSELKLDIIKEYATAYSTILTAKKLPHVYIDGFAGAGVHKSKTSEEFILGSPLNALKVKPPFKEFFFIDIEAKKTASLRNLVGDRQDVHIYPGDANKILLTKVFPEVLYENHRRGLCLLDPYGLHLNWGVIATAGKMETLDMFLNFPIMDANRNFLWRHPEKLGASGTERLNSFWGDNSWRKAAYRTQETLFGPEEVKEENPVIVQAFCERLRNVAGFAHVAKPLPMRNSRRGIVYYLLFASPKQVAGDIVDHIFKKYEKRGLL